MEGAKGSPQTQGEGPTARDAWLLSVSRSVKGGKAHLCPIAVALRVDGAGKGPTWADVGAALERPASVSPSPPFAAVLLAQGQYDLDDPAYPEPPYAPYEIGEYQQGSGARLDLAGRVDCPPPALLPGARITFGLFLLSREPGLLRLRRER